MSLSCFRPATNAEVAPPRIPTHPNLATSLYRTQSGLFGLTWSRDHPFGRSLHIYIHLHDQQGVGGVLSLPTHQFTNPSFHLQIRPWKKRGSHRLPLLPAADVHWDLSRAKFGSAPDPSSGFYVAILIHGQLALLVGDAIPRATAGDHVPFPFIRRPPPPPPQVMFLRREHVYGNKQMLYATKTDFGVAGGEREIAIDCRLGVDDPRLYFSIDKKRVLQIKHLKWKFRGNERIQVDGIPIQVSWDVHSWLFQKQPQQQRQQPHEEPEADGCALFMFKFEKPSPPQFRFGSVLFQDQDEDDDDDDSSSSSEKGKYLKWKHHHQQHHQTTCGFGFESKKMKKGLKMLRSGRSSHHSSSSSSSSSLSSASSGCSSVMEWESVEENELKDPSGFSLLVYAWKS